MAEQSPHLHDKSDARDRVSNVARPHRPDQRLQDPDDDRMPARASKVGHGVQQEPVAIDRQRDHVRIVAWIRLDPERRPFCAADLVAAGVCHGTKGGQGTINTLRGRGELEFSHYGNTPRRPGVKPAYWRLKENGK
jgi:hypothetical protein